MRTLRRARLSLAAVVLAACASPGKRPTQTEVRTERGFVITESLSVGSDVRADFEAAVQRLEQNDTASGIALLLKLTEAAPQLTAAHIDLAMAYEQTGDMEHAEASLKRALALSPRHPVIYNELGIVYRKTGRFEEARRSYTRALELHPEFHFARRNLAILCDVYLDDPACALENYELYANAAPDDEAASAWIADLHKRLGK
jgi:Flp pilus assembly protein TadD